MTKRRPTVLYVFVSSPGDCRPERDLVVQLLEELNESEEARQANIVFEALRWENLPPGADEARDYQRRIDGLLRKADLDRFHIYLGFMRRRAGTPTPRHPSGTIEEFETAFSRKRRTGLPAEVSFYFLTPADAMEPEVAAFRNSLAERGFLYADASAPGQFAVLLRAHLKHVLLGWWQWKNRLRRQLRNTKVVGIALAGLALATGIATEAATSYQIRQALEHQQPASALQIWYTRGTYLPITHATLSTRIDTALHTVAANRLIESLTAQGLDPFDWKREQLRPFESALLSAHSRRVLAMDSGRRHSTALLPLAALAEDWPRAARLASEAARLARASDPPEIRGFILNAPPQDVAAWLQNGLPDQLAPHIASAILASGARRRDTALAFQLLDALRLGKLGRDAQRFDLALDCDRAQPGCHEAANRTLMRWLRDGKDLPMEALRLLLTWSEPAKLSPPERLEIEPALLQLFASKQYADISATMTDFLARFDSPAVRERLEQRIQQHASGTISYGFAERRALLDAMRALPAGPWPARALAIAQASAKEAAALDGPYAPNDGAVQAAYLHLLGRSANIDWPRHRSWVDTQLRRRLRSEFPDFYRAEVDQGFATLLSRPDKQAFFDLFGKASPGIVDSLDGSLSARRAYLLGRLPQDQALPQTIVETVCRSIPVSEPARAAFRDMLARLGGPAGKACLLAQGGPPDPEHLARWGDVGGLVALLRGDSARADGAWKTVLAAADHLAPLHQSEFLLAAFPLAQASDRPALFALARRSGVALPAIVAAASKEIGETDNPLRIAAAIDYLRVVAPADAWSGLRASVTQLAEVMARCDAFGWIQIAQVFPAPLVESDLSVLQAILAKRRFLLVLDETQVARSERLPARLMSIRNKLVGNPLLGLLAARNGQRTATSLATARSSQTGLVDTLGELPDKNTAYQAYLDWLLADVIAHMKGPASEHLSRAELRAWLDTTDPITVRAGAGRILAELARRHPNRAEFAATATHSASDG